ncbi:MAG: hypothetical protein A3B68_04480 [Candidatus Melainabacteria bacterium RIFCSPHIGHO2_02_FULL_34_12]|nr:MAG: hypothetical protein A3B68_04480 [Candidatus Melainabacteria bacterium RIFCSPHIGHO2_02_FULL_34_12]
MSFLYKNNTDRFIFIFLYLLILCTYGFLNYLPSVLAEVSEESKIEKHDRLPLRGEIWYGNASWYGNKFHGRRTSNGEKFNKNKLTAAHPYLPFNTKVLVTNLKNNKSVVVRINDRGPFIKNRILDLSEKAAEKIDAKKHGTAYIKLQVLTPITQDETET